jgi:hypothetical protein
MPFICCRCFGEPSPRPPDPDGPYTRHIGALCAEHRAALCLRCRINVGVSGGLCTECAEEVWGSVA